jgi:hypothetical protein
MSPTSVKRGLIRGFMVALLTIVLTASMSLAGTNFAYADWGWEKIGKATIGKDKYVYGLSYEGTFVKGKKVRGVITVKSSDSKVSIPKKIKGLPVYYVDLSTFTFGGKAWSKPWTVKGTTKNIKSINLKKATGLGNFNLQGSKVKSLNFSKNKKLSLIDIYNAKKLKTTKLSKNTKLKSIRFRGCKSLKPINLSKNTKLTSLTITGSDSLTAINVSKNTKLTFLSITDCKNLKSIDLSKNTKLEHIVLDEGVTVTGQGDRKIYWV